MSQILADALRAHVHELAEAIGERSPGRPEALARARDYVLKTLTGYGYEVSRQAYGPSGEFENLEARLPGSGGPEAGLLVVGAHYDTVPGTPGADDNASGVAGLLELARLSRGGRPRRTVVFAAFSTEEAPFFGTPEMGSRVFAERLSRQGDKVEGMIALEMIGFYSAKPGLQRYPPLLGWMFPDRADFVALVGNRRSRPFLRRLRAALKDRLRLPLEHACLPELVRGVSLSDHSSFWDRDYPAVMLTDTAFYRNPHYHQAGDREDTLDYVSLSALVEGLSGALSDLAR